ncbi:MAG: T9SS type A sorting domain-containing protein [Bacteroidales bacterium]|nr:T9SS type A sorting domain-containing protein [Bacteroidales bacterium]
MDFQNNLAGGGVYDLTNGAAVPVTAQPTVTANTAFLPVNLTIPDGGTVSLEAFIYIDNNNAPDGGILQFQINAASHGFTTDAAGSGFEDPFTGGNIVGNNFTVDVVATQFTFLTQPSDVNINTTMTPAPQVAGTDVNGNIDIDYSSPVSLTYTGTGNMAVTSPVNPVSGIADFSDITFDTPSNNETITASDGTFTNVVSNTFNILPDSGGATCANAVAIDVGTHHAIHPQGGSGDYDQWYVYHATANGTITVSDCGQTIDTDLRIIADNCSGTNFDETDDNCSTQETLDFTVVAGTDYYIGWGNWDTAGDEHNWTLSFRKDVNIINAYAVSNDSLVVFYESGLSSVNPADYTLTAISQTTVNFTNATIDATHDSIVYLKAQNNFAINVLRDNINDAYNNATYQFYAGVLPVAYTNTANAPDTVRQGYNVTLSGVVTANDNYNQVWIQDSDNPKSGVMVYNSSFDALVAVGDSITVEGQKEFNYGATRIINPMLIAVESGHTAVAANINSSDLNYNATQDDPTAEQWEGQLVTVCGIVIDSLDSQNHYEYFGHNSNGDIICFDDDVDYHYGSGFSLTSGSMYSITGVVTYSYGHYKINPRGPADAVETDQTSVVVAPDTQVPDATINGALAVDSLHAIEAFKFKVTDEGTDGLPTKISQITIYTGPNNTVDLSGNAIAGGWFDFGDATNPIVFTGEPQFDTDHLIFAVDPETAIIDNGTSKDIILHVWFDTSIADESVLQLTVKADPHGFVADCMNSQFASTFASDVTGGTLTIDTNVGIKDVFANSIRIYPNPSNGIFNIDVKNKCKLEISDITGRVLNTKTLTGNTSIELNTAGIYFLKFSNDKGSYIQKVIVK